jgi:hypothetical protein
VPQPTTIPRAPEKDDGNMEREKEVEGFLELYRG